MQDLIEDGIRQSSPAGAVVLAQHQFQSIAIANNSTLMLHAMHVALTGSEKV